MEQKRDSFRVGVNVFAIRDGKLLLGKRKDDWPGGGGWGLPGGHLEKGETMKYRAAQELDEETGLHAKSFEFVVLSNNYRGNNVHYIQTGFVAHGLEEKEPELREPDHCYEWRWFEVDNLPDPVFIGHQSLLKTFLEKKPFIDE